MTISKIEQPEFAAIGPASPIRQQVADASETVATETEPASPRTLLDRCDAIRADAAKHAVAYLLRSDTSQGGE